MERIMERIEEFLRKYPGICIVIFCIAVYGQLGIFLYPAKTEFVSKAEAATNLPNFSRSVYTNTGNAGAETTYTLDGVSFDACIANDDDMATDYLIVNLTAEGKETYDTSDIKLYGGDSYCFRNFATKAITITDGTGTSPWRIFALQVTEY